MSDIRFPSPAIYIVSIGDIWFVLIKYLMACISLPKIRDLAFDAIFKTHMNFGVLLHNTPRFFILIIGSTPIITPITSTYAASSRSDFAIHHLGFSWNTTSYPGILWETSWSPLTSSGRSDEY